jgi:hypothetical protein
VKSFRCATCEELGWRFKLIAVNSRLWDWHGLAAARGFELPRTAYLDAIGESPPLLRRNVDSKRRAIALARGSRPALQPRTYVDGMWARDEPKPAVVHPAPVFRP